MSSLNGLKWPEMVSIEPPPGPTVIFVVAKVREKQMRLLQPPAPEDD